MKKSVWLAAGLNLIPGLGYLYVGSRMAFALLLLSVWPLFILAGLMTPWEEIEATQTVPFRVTDLLPFLALSAAFVVDGYVDAARFNEQNKK